MSLRSSFQTCGWRALLHLLLLSRTRYMASHDRAHNPLTPGAFCQKCVFRDILVVFRLDLGQISFNVVENAFATRQRALLATRIAFLEVEIKILNLDEKVIFFSFSFLLLQLLTLYWACFRLKKLLRKRHRDGQFVPWSSLGRVVQAQG